MFMVGLALPAIGWMIWAANASQSVEAELAKIRELGEPIEPTDMDSFYVIPDGKSDATKLWTEVAAIFDTEAYGERAKAIPVVGQGSDIPPVGEEWEQLEAVAAFLDEYREEMKKIHEAARLGGQARFDRDFDEGLAMLLPDVQGLRGCNRMLKLEARVAAHRGDAAAAARSIHAMFSTCHAVQEDPLLISHLVRVALAGMAIGELETAIGESVAFSDDDLQMLREDIRSIDFKHSLERALMGERVIGLLTFRNPGRFDIDNNIPFPTRANNEDLALYLSTVAKYIEASRAPFPEALSLADEATAHVTEVAGSSQINKLRYAFTNLLLPAVNATFEASARGTGASHCGDVAMAIEQYRRKRGEIPGSLQELVPEFLDSVPIDPMDGQPLRYVINDDGYVLYSVGRNRVDDGGVMGDKRLDEVFAVKLRTTSSPAESNE